MKLYFVTLLTTSLSAVVAASGYNTTSSNMQHLLSMPFSSMLTLEPASLHKIAEQLNVNTQFILKDEESNIIDSQRVKESVTRLITAIEGMDKNGLADIVHSSSVRRETSKDPLVLTGSIFTIGQLMSLDTRRLDKVAELFVAMAHIRAFAMPHFLRDIGWVSTDKPASPSEITIPDLSYLFPLRDSTLGSIAEAAVSYTQDTPPESLANIRYSVFSFLGQLRQIFSWGGVVDGVLYLIDNPTLNAIRDLVNLSYKYPNASYLDLILMYFKVIGGPGLQIIANYPSQYVGNIASSAVGGYVSSAIAGLIGAGETSTVSTTTSSGYNIFGYLFGHGSSSESMTPTSAPSTLLKLISAPTPTHTIEIVTFN